MLGHLVTATLDSRLPKTGIGVPCRGGLLFGRAGFVLAAMLGLLACSESEDSTPPDPPPGFSESRWQTDAHGRVVLHPWCPKTRSRAPSIIQRSRVSCRLMAEERG